MIGKMAAGRGFGARPGRFIAVTALLLAVGCSTVAAGSSDAPYLLVANASTVSKVSLENGYVLDVLLTGDDIQRAVAVGVDIEDNWLFWTDVNYDRRGLYRARLDGTGVDLLASEDIYEPNGVGVDWLANNIYLTDAQQGTIEVIKYDGSSKKTVITGLDIPRGIAVDPTNGYLYWGDQGKKTIERSRMDGSDREVLVDDGLFWPNEMVIDYRSKKLYWVDGYTRLLECYDLQYRTHSQVANITNVVGNSVSFGLALHNDKLYFTVWDEGAVYSIPTSGSSEPTLLLQGLGDRPFGLQAVDSNSQNTLEQGACGDNNGMCSHLCLPTGRYSYKCACPSYGGMTLGSDRRTCEEPSKFLLYAAGDTGHVMMLSLDTNAGQRPVIVARGVRPVAVEYDPVEKRVYYSDNGMFRICRVFLNGTGFEVFLDAGIGVVDGMTLDWRNRKLYFTNMGTHYWGGGSPWQRVEMVGLDGKQRRRIVEKSLDKPRALVVDTERGYLYYSDWGEVAKVVKVELDGSNAVVMNHNGMHNPNGLALSAGQLYILDSHARLDVVTENGTQLAPGSLDKIDLDDQNVRNTNDGLGLQTPFGISVKGSQIFISDWGTSAIHLIDSDTNQKSVLVTDVGSPMGVKYAERDAAPVQNPCRSHDCSDICVPTPAQSFRCLCPDIGGKVLDDNGKSCRRPTKFLLFADYAEIRMLGMDTQDSYAYPVVQRHEYFTNLVAVTYDSREENIYFSNVDSGMIMRVHLNGTGASVVYSMADVVDGLAIDPVGRNLYWTDYTSGTVEMMPLDGNVSSHVELISGLDKPRAIGLDPNQRYLFWSDWGENATIWRADMDGSNKNALIDEELQWPNGIALDTVRERVFFADGHSAQEKIEYTDYRGVNRTELVHLTDTHVDQVFGLTMHDNTLFYSDWVSKGIHLTNLESGITQVLVEGLTRPTQLYLHHPQPYPENECTAYGCSDMAIPVPGGCHCKCRVGRKLKADDKTCETAPEPWIRVEDWRCAQSCHEQAYCAVEVSNPTLYRCVCKAGYQGNGFQGSGCTACDFGYYKSVLRPGQCTQCPDGVSSTAARTSCVCRGGLQWYMGECTSDVPEVTARPTTPLVFPGTMPRFESCPDTHSWQLPEDANYVTWDIRLRALDGYDRPLEISPRVPPVIYYGTGSMIHQFTATDQWDNMVKCRIEVTIEDITPPQLVCPDDIIVETSGESAIVRWDAPVTSDNSGKKPMLTSSRTPGSRFFRENSPHTVTYSARDEAGNPSTCSFIVAVQGPKCPELEVPRNGRLDCTEGDRERGPCTVVCNRGYQLLSGPATSYCLGSVWSSIITTFSCVRASAPRRQRRSVNMRFSGYCSSEESFQNEFRDGLYHSFQTNGLCTPGQTDEVGLCNRNNYNVQCGLEKRSLFGRMKRAGDGVSVEIPLEVQPDQSGDAVATVDEGDEVLEKAVEQVERLTDAGVTVEARGETYVSTSDSFTASAITYECDQGMVEVNKVCVTCPAGTFHDGDKCTYCVQSFYQPEEGQLSCKACPEGTVTDMPGAYRKDQCMVPPEPQSSAGLPIAIIAGAAGGGALLIIIIVAIVCCARRASRNKEGGSPSKRNEKVQNFPNSIYEHPAGGSVPPQENVYAEIPEYGYKGDVSAAPPLPAQRKSGPPSDDTYQGLQKTQDNTYQGLQHPGRDSRKKMKVTTIA
ncbi:low-density lipoprotein receptor-related protein 5-like isoform X2 [Branchiostoma floridae x Branchiostoma japonicum]